MTVSYTVEVMHVSVVEGAMTTVVSGGQEYPDVSSQSVTCAVA